MRFSPMSAALAALLATASAAAAENPALTIYRADGDALFENGNTPVADGYAIVHEQRVLKAADAQQLVVIDGLPAMLDAEAIAIELGGGARILAQRVLSSGDGGVLGAHRGEKVTVLSSSHTLVGTLLGVDNGAPIVRDDATGQAVYVRSFDTMQFQNGGGARGSTLQLVVAGNVANAAATLTYPTSGLGWRAAYSALLLDNAACRMRLDALASIANRSGRDYPQAALKLIAGAPNIARQGGPRSLMGKAMMDAVPASSIGLPEQSALGDYRSYAIEGALDLPDASVTQVPLYAPGEFDCQRSWISDAGNAWYSHKPMTGRDDISVASHGPVVSELRFTPSENLPAGHLRVSTRDRDNRIELLGDARVADTQKGRALPVALGDAFDLSANRERTSFTYDKATHTVVEGFRVALANTGETARTVSVREHPNRWRVWSLVSSTQKPATQSPDLLAFDVAVPANGKATVEYVVKYVWTQQDE